MYSKDHKKSKSLENEEESQDSGVKRVAAKQPFSDTKKKKTFQEDSSFDYADMQKNVLALCKQQEMLETMMKHLRIWKVFQNVLSIFLKCKRIQD